MEEKYFLKGMNGQIKVYDDKIVITRKGFFSFLTQGLSGERTVPMSSIRSVQFKEGGWATNGFIQFGVVGGIEKQGGILKATEDENSVVIKKGEQSKTAKLIKDFVEQRIIELSKPQATVINQAASAADEILKLKQLLDAGIISQDEFDAKKKQLLGL